MTDFADDERLDQIIVRKACGKGIEVENMPWDGLTQRGRSIVKRAAACEAAIDGAAWDRETIERACAALAEDFAPISDARAAADIRLLAVQNLLRRFYLETTGAAPETVYTYGR